MGKFNMPTRIFLVKGKNSKESPLPAKCNQSLKGPKSHNTNKGGETNDNNKWKYFLCCYGRE